jgi:hypothetical protein
LSAGRLAFGREDQERGGASIGLLFGLSLAQDRNHFVKHDQTGAEGDESCRRD